MRQMTGMSFIADAIHSHITAHGSSPLRVEISPQTFWSIKHELVALGMLPRTGTPDTPTIHGVPIGVIRGCPPRLISQTGEVEEI
jgi:hypothetical protein